MNSLTTPRAAIPRVDLSPGHTDAGKRASHALSQVCYWLQLALIVPLLLSPIGVVLLTVQGKFFLEPVLAIVGIAFVVNRQIGRVVHRRLTNHHALLALLFLFAIFLEGSFLFGDIAASYADFRTCLLLVFSYLLVFKNTTMQEEQKYRLLLHVTFLTMACDLISAKYLTDPSEIKIGFNILATSLALYISSRILAPWLFIVAAICSTVEAIQSFYRTYWLVAAISVVGFGTLLLIRLVKRKRFVAGLLFFGLAVSCGAVIIRSGIVVDYLKSSQGRMIQSIAKAQDFVSIIFGEQEARHGDDLRLAYFQFMFERAPTLVMPHGLGSRKVFGNLDDFFNRFDTPTNTADSAILFAAYHFGLAASFLAAIVLFKRLRSRLASTSTIDKTYVFVGLTVILLFSLTVGDFFVVVQRGIFAGAYVGAILNRNI